MGVEDLVEEIASIVGGELGVPDQLLDFPDADGLQLVPAVIDAEAGLEVDGVLGDLVDRKSVV